MSENPVKKLFESKTVRIIALCIIALLLLLAVWAVFFRKDEAVQTGSYQPTEQESRLSLLLAQIEGIDRATVMIGEEDGEPKSVVVVFEGADSLLTRMRIMEVASSTLRIDRGQVLVYPAQS